LRCLRRAVETLPEGVERVYLRADSAAYEHELMEWCNEADAEGEPRATFAISADMSRPLRQAVERLGRDRWQVLDNEGGYTRWWAEVEYVPSLPTESKGRRADRYLAIRVAREQGELFADGTEVKHFAVVTNDWGRDGGALLRWHREKCGTVEKVHDVLKNELGAGVMPCGRFGANAAWFRLNVLTYNVLSVLKRTALPASLHEARPKRLRFQVLRQAGEVLYHARRVGVRVVGWFGAWLGMLAAARRKLEALRVLLARAGPAPRVAAIA
jgi:hypothetical protein